jgi:hypothetical protein
MKEMFEKPLRDDQLCNLSVITKDRRPKGMKGKHLLVISIKPMAREVITTYILTPSKQDPNTFRFRSGFDYIIGADKKRKPLEKLRDKILNKLEKGSVLSVKLEGTDDVKSKKKKKKLKKVLS